MNLKPDLFYYTKIIDVLTKLKEINEIKKILQEMNEKFIEPDTIFYNVLIDGYVKNGFIEEAIEILINLIENKKADQLSFSSILTYSMINKNAQLMEQITQLMKHHKIVPNLDFFKQIHSFVKGDILKLRLLFQQLKSFQIQPDCYLYNSLLEIYMRQNEISLGRAVIDEMISNEIQPNLSSFNMLLNGYSFEGDLDGFNRTLREMQQYNILPDIRTINSKMNLFLTRKEYQNTVDIFYHEITGFFLPDQFSFMYLFDAFGNLNDLHKIQMEILNIKSELKDDILNTRVFNSYLLALARCDAWNQLDLELDWMIHSSPPNCKPSSFTFTSILEVCKIRGKWDIFDDYVKLHDKVLGVALNNPAYSTLLRKRQSVLFKKRFGNKI